MFETSSTTETTSQEYVYDRNYWATVAMQEFIRNGYANANGMVEEAWKIAKAMEFEQNKANREWI